MNQAPIRPNHTKLGDQKLDSKTIFFVIEAKNTTRFCAEPFFRISKNCFFYFVLNWFGFYMAFDVLHGFTDQVGAHSSLTLHPSCFALHPPLPLLPHPSPFLLPRSPLLNPFLASVYM